MPHFPQQLLCYAMLLMPSILWSQYTSIPDANFEQGLVDQGIDTEGTLDGQILTADAEAVTYLDVSSQRIEDLTGIEAFVNITDLNCSSNEIEALDLSALLRLFDLDCSLNRLFFLDLPKNLSILNCYYNQLEFLDLTANQGMYMINCQGNYDLQVIDLLHQFDYGNPGYLFADDFGDTLCVRVLDQENYENNWTIYGNAQFVDECTTCGLINSWKGGQGYWQDDGKWSLGHKPRACEHVNIRKPGSDVLIYQGNTMEATTVAISGSAKLTISNTAKLTLDCTPNDIHRSAIAIYGGGQLINQGTIEQTCSNQYGITMGASSLINNTGTIIIKEFNRRYSKRAGIRLSSGSSFTNNGRIEIDPDTVASNSEGILVEPGNSFTNSVSGILEINKIKGASANGIDNQGIFLNLGTIAIDSVGTAAGIYNHGSASFENNGTISLINIENAPAVFNDTMASWSGNGTITADTFAMDAGNFSTGYPYKKATINADILKTGSSVDTFRIGDIAGAGTSLDNDQMIVNGDLHLDGKIVSTIQFEYTPAPQDSFIIIKYAGALSGQYSTSEVPPSYAVDYAIPGEVILRYTPCLHPDMAALLAIYDSTNGSAWIENTGWADGALGSNCTPCDGSWIGISCRDNRVISIALPDNNLEGVIPSEIALLEQLQTLDLTSNVLTGEIPISIDVMDSLVHVDLSNNQLSGTIPRMLFMKAKLETIYLDRNNFEALEDLDQMPLSGSIKNIFLNHNPSLTSTLPKSFSTLDGLQNLDLSNTSFNGCYPTSYFTMCDLNANFENTELPAFSSFCEEDGIGACNNCDYESKDIDDTPIAQGTFIKVRTEINSAGYIESSNHVIFHAGDSIQLHAGFTVNDGALFIAEVRPCDSSE